MHNKGSYAIAGAVGSLAPRRFHFSRAVRKRIILVAATAHSLKRYEQFIKIAPS